jgi:winged helix DNA-binding protein
MDGEVIGPRRMHNQRLWGEPFDAPEEVVRWLGAMQAQEFAVAKWSVAQRTGEPDLAAVDRAFADGTILRTHLLRPTWHFALAEDIRWLLSATGPRVQQLNAYYNKQRGIDEALAARSNAALAKALEGGKQATRKELAAILERAGVAECSGVRLAYIIMRAELDAIVVSGAMRGKQHTYALLDERAPNATRLGRDEALAELTRRYFVSRGPATLRDYARWSSLTAGECRAGLEKVKAELDHEEVDGRTYWFGSPPRTPKRPPAPRVDLVQGYDEIVMSYSESKDVVAPPAAIPLYRDGHIFLHAILLDGRLIGHWRHNPPKGSVIIETSLDRSLEPLEAQALDAAVERYGRFLGVPARVSSGGRAATR